MADVTLTIPDNKLDAVKEALAGLYPIPTQTDEQTGETTPLFTENQWAKECVRRWVVAQEARWRQVKAQRAVAFEPDDTIVT